MSSEVRTLYLEDETLIALDGESSLRELGLETIHSARSLSKAKSIARTEELDLAILDVNLGNGQNSFELALELVQRGLKVLFVSGYNATEFPASVRGVPVLSKPFTKHTLAAALHDM
ncbi:MAG: response regulator [Pseudomonadota bacterium]